MKIAQPDPSHKQCRGSLDNKISEWSKIMSIDPDVMLIREQYGSISGLADNRNHNEAGATLAHWVCNEPNRTGTGLSHLSCNERTCNLYLVNTF